MRGIDLVPAGLLLRTGGAVLKEGTLSCQNRCRISKTTQARMGR